MSKISTEGKKIYRRNKITDSFFRVVKNKREIDYIVNNTDYIMSIIKKNNSQNDICFVLLEVFPDLPDSLAWFKVPIKQYIGGTLETRKIVCDEIINQIKYEPKKYRISCGQ